MADNGTGQQMNCSRDDIEDLVEICSAICSPGHNFHSCVDKDPTAIPDNWFCSDVCRCPLHLHVIQLSLEFRNKLTNDWM